LLSAVTHCHLSQSKNLPEAQWGFEDYVYFAAGWHLGEAQRRFRGQMAFWRGTVLEMRCEFKDHVDFAARWNFGEAQLRKTRVC
jgi:hypothetical protein